MQVTDSILVRAPANPKLIEGIQKPDAIQHALGFCQVFDRQHLDQETLDRRPVEAETDSTVIVEVADQSDPDLENISVAEVDVVERDDLGTRYPTDAELDSDSHEKVPDQRAILLQDPKNRDQSFSKLEAELEADGRLNVSPRLANDSLRTDKVALPTKTRATSPIEAALTNEMRSEGDVKAPKYEPSLQGKADGILLMANESPQFVTIHDKDRVNFDFAATKSSQVDQIKAQPLPSTQVTHNVAVKPNILPQPVEVVSHIDKSVASSTEPPVLRPKTKLPESQILPRSELARNEVGVTTNIPAFASSPTHQPLIAQSVDMGRPVMKVIGRPVLKVEDVPKASFEQALEARHEIRLASVVAATPQSLRPEMNQTIIRQMTDAVRAQITAEKTVEIALRPAELGRVRIALSPADAGMIVTISAERAETLELMRRNIDDLARSFTEMGYENPSFNFEQGGEFDHKDDRELVMDQTANDSSSDPGSDIINQTQAPVLRTQSTGVDILV